MASVVVLCQWIFVSYGMKEAIKSYTNSLINDVPHSTYEGMLSAMCIGIVLLWAWKGRRAGNYIVWLLLVEYSFLLYCSTVIYRKALQDGEYDLMPFWSYRAIVDGKEQLLAENIMNVVVFVPVGVLFGLAMRRRNVRAALLVGAGLSVGIEVLQFVLKCGFSEFDDVFHNTLGCLIGIMIVEIIKRVWKFCAFLFVPQWGRHPKDAGILE